MLILESLFKSLSNFFFLSNILLHSCPIHDWIQKRGELASKTWLYMSTRLNATHFETFQYMLLTATVNGCELCNHVALLNAIQIYLLIKFSYLCRYLVFDIVQIFLFTFREVQEPASHCRKFRSSQN